MQLQPDFASKGRPAEAYGLRPAALVSRPPRGRKLERGAELCFFVARRGPFNSGRTDRNVDQILVSDRIDRQTDRQTDGRTDGINKS